MQRKKNLKMTEINIYFENNANLDKIKGKKIAIIGYGNQGRAQELNLRDSDQDVIIGNKEDSYKEKALKDGFKIFNI